MGSGAKETLEDCCAGLLWKKNFAMCIASELQSVPSSSVLDSL